MFLCRSACRDSHPLDDVSQLAPELWTRIFSQIATDIDSMYQDSGSPDEIWPEQAHFRGLQLVCKTFRNIFTEYPMLSEAVALPDIPPSLIPSLLAWLRSHSSSIRLLASNGLWLDMALASLAISMPPLLASLIATDCVETTTMAILPVFTCLQLCDLTTHNIQGTPLDLLPLQALPALQHLKLRHGEFCNLYSASYLTNLFIAESTVWSRQDCSFAGSLRSLHIEGSEVEGFHSKGVCACTSLELFELSELKVGARQGNEMLQHQMYKQMHIPHSITSLTSLRSVKILVMQYDSPQPYDWLCALTTLTSLCIVSRSCSFFIVPDALTRLQQLQSFTVTRLAMSTRCPPIMKLQVDWRWMQQLKEVRFIGQSVVCDGKILCLALVKSLKVLEVSACVPRCDVSKQNMAFLADCIALHNPQMAFIDLHRIPKSLFESNT